MTTTTLAKAGSEKSEKLFDKSKGQSYVDCILDFIDNARASQVDVKDIESLEQRFERAERACAELEKRAQLATEKLKWVEKRAEDAERNAHTAKDIVQKYTNPQHFYGGDPQKWIGEVMQTRCPTPYCQDYSQTWPGHNCSCEDFDEAKWWERFNSMRFEKQQKMEKS